jgi:hypothetical protein
MAWLIPFSLASWNWLFRAAKSVTSYLRQYRKGEQYQKQCKLMS